jgi:hypothetical protein
MERTNKKTDAVSAWIIHSLGLQELQFFLKKFREFEIS